MPHSVANVTPEELRDLAHNDGSDEARPNLISFATLEDLTVGHNPNQPIGALEVVLWFDDPVTPDGLERDYAGLHAWLTELERLRLTKGKDAYYHWFHPAPP